MLWILRQGTSKALNSSGEFSLLKMHYAQVELCVNRMGGQVEVPSPGNRGPRSSVLWQAARLRVRSEKSAHWGLLRWLDLTRESRRRGCLCSMTKVQVNSKRLRYSDQLPRLCDKALRQPGAHRVDDAS